MELLKFIARDQNVIAVAHGRVDEGKIMPGLDRELLVELAEGVLEGGEVVHLVDPGPPAVHVRKQPVPTGLDADGEIGHDLAALADDLPDALERGLEHGPVHAARQAGVEVHAHAVDLVPDARRRIRPRPVVHLADDDLAVGVEGHVARAQRDPVWPMAPSVPYP